eukprot:COSAG06_NODE_742_length_12659_cov_504.915127_10_plen_53_part_00
MFSCKTHCSRQRSAGSTAPSHNDQPANAMLCVATQITHRAQVKQTADKVDSR